MDIDQVADHILKSHPLEPYDSFKQKLLDHPLSTLCTQLSTMQAQLINELQRNSQDVKQVLLDSIHRLDSYVSQKLADLKQTFKNSHSLGLIDQTLNQLRNDDFNQLKFNMKGVVHLSNLYEHPHSFTSRLKQEIDLFPAKRRSIQSTFHSLLAEFASVSNSERFYEKNEMIKVVSHFKHLPKELANTKNITTLNVKL